MVTEYVSNQAPALLRLTHVVFMGRKHPIPELPSTFGNMTAAHAEMVAHGIRSGRWFAVDNECFTRPFSIDRMQHHLAKLTPI